MRRQHDENSLMAICRVEGRGGTGGGLEGHDRDVVGACWPGVLKAASAAFAAGVRDAVPSLEPPSIVFPTRLSVGSMMKVHLITGIIFPRRLFRGCVPWSCPACFSARTNLLYLLSYVALAFQPDPPPPLSVFMMMVWCCMMVLYLARRDVSPPVHASVLSTTCVKATQYHPLQTLEVKGALIIFRVSFLPYEPQLVPKQCRHGIAICRLISIVY